MNKRYISLITDTGTQHSRLLGVASEHFSRGRESDGLPRLQITHGCKLECVVLHSGLWPPDA